VLRKTLRRGQMERFFASLAPTLIGLEACGAAHHWARVLQALGHEVRLLPPQYVKPYVKRGKNDAADAEAICEAMSRPSMRFVPVRSRENQAGLMLLTARDLLLKQKTMLINAIRGHAAEFGVTGRKGADSITALLPTMKRSPSSRARSWRGCSSKWKAWSGRPANSRESSWPGIAPATAAAGWRQSPVSGRSAPRRWQ
jgi:transposase